MTTNPLLAAISLHRHKGHDPLTQLKCFTYSDQDGSERFAFGLRDYGTGAYVFESDKLYKTRAAAIAAIGRALDSEAEL